MSASSSTTTADQDRALARIINKNPISSNNNKDLLTIKVNEDLWQRGETFFHHPAEQGTDLWKRLRLGYISGTKISPATGRSNFTTREQCAKYVTLLETPSFTEDALKRMQAGSDAEPRVRQKYANQTGNSVAEYGLCVSSRDPRLAASVDGVIVSDDGLIEIKCPQRMYGPLKYKGKIWDSHYDQMQLGMFVLGRTWCDYVVNALDTEEMIITRVNWDQNHWDTVLMPKLEEFFDTILPAVVADAGLETVPDYRILPPGI